MRDRNGTFDTLLVKSISLFVDMVGELDLASKHRLDRVLCSFLRVIPQAIRGAGSSQKNRSRVGCNILIMCYSADRTSL